MSQLLTLPNCPICFDQFEEFANISACACGHTFHHDCITKWAINSKAQGQPVVCPTCKKRFETTAARGVIKKLFFTFDQNFNFPKSSDGEKELYEQREVSKALLDEVGARDAEIMQLKQLLRSTEDKIKSDKSYQDVMRIQMEDKLKVSEAMVMSLQDENMALSKKNDILNEIVNLVTAAGLTTSSTSSYGQVKSENRLPPVHPEQQPIEEKNFLMSKPMPSVPLSQLTALLGNSEDIDLPSQSVGSQIDNSVNNSIDDEELSFIPPDLHKDFSFHYGSGFGQQVDSVFMSSFALHPDNIYHVSVLVALFNVSPKAKWRDFEILIPGIVDISIGKSLHCVTGVAELKTSAIAAFNSVEEADLAASFEKIYLNGVAIILKKVADVKGFLPMRFAGGASSSSFKHILEKHAKPSASLDHDATVMMSQENAPVSKPSSFSKSSPLMPLQHKAINKTDASNDTTFPTSSDGGGRPLGGGVGYSAAPRVRGSVVNRARHPDSHQLFVGNIPLDATEQELKDFFVEFGPVLELRIDTKGSGPTSKKVPHFGFVVFDSPEPVQMALRNKPLIFRGDYRINVEEKKAQKWGPI